MKIEVKSYGSTMELRELAAISAPEPALLLVKPFDPVELLRAVSEYAAESAPPR